MYVCMNVCAYIRMYGWMDGCRYVRMYVCSMYVCTYVRTYVCMYACPNRWPYFLPRIMPWLLSELVQITWSLTIFPTNINHDTYGIHGCLSRSTCIEVFLEVRMQLWGVVMSGPQQCPSLPHSRRLPFCMPPQPSARGRSSVNSLWTSLLHWQLQSVTEGHAAIWVEPPAYTSVVKEIQCVVPEWEPIQTRSLFKTRSFIKKKHRKAHQDSISC